MTQFLKVNKLSQLVIVGLFFLGFGFLLNKGPIFKQGWKANDLPSFHLSLSIRDSGKLSTILDHVRKINFRDEYSKQWINGSLKIENERFPVKIRLRGNVSNHWSGKKISLRIKIKGTKLYRGIREFNLIIPEDRGFFVEDLGAWWAKKFNMLSPALEMIVLNINGVNYGYYLFQEELGPEFFERNNHPAGPIFRTADNLFNPKYINDRNLIYNIASWNVDSPLEYQDSINANFDYLLSVFRNLDPSKKDKYQIIESMFDINEAAKISALSRLFGSHSEAPHSVIVYFDISRVKFVPIFLDQVIEIRSIENFEGGNNEFNWNVFSHELLQFEKFQKLRDGYLKLILENESVFMNYFDTTRKAADRLKQDSFLSAPWSNDKAPISSSEFESVVNGFRVALVENLKVIKNYFSIGKPFKRMPISKISNLDLQVFARLESIGGIQFLKLFKSDSKIHLGSQLKSVTLKFENPIKSDSLICDKFKIKQKSKKTLDIILDDFLLPFDLDLSCINQKPKNFVLNFLGQTDWSGTTLSWDNFNSDQLDPLKNRFLEDFKDLVKGNVILFTDIRYEINDSYVIPPGYKVIIEPGASLLFSEKASIVSFSSIEGLGTPLKPITISPLDEKVGFGVFAIIGNTKISASRFRYLNFNGARGGQIGSIFFTGGFAVFNSPFELINSEIGASGNDDGLNVKNGKVKIIGNIFLKNPSDAIDLDWCEGQIKENLFYFNGGDGIDISGANQLSVVRNFILFGGDKGISVGERSNVDLSENLIIGNSIGIASKDLSMVNSTENTILKSKLYSYAAYQKKEIFGPAKLLSKNSYLDPSVLNFSCDSLSEVQIENDKSFGRAINENILKDKNALEKEVLRLISDEQTHYWIGSRWKFLDGKK